MQYFIKIVFSIKQSGAERPIARMKRLEEDLDYLQEAIKKLAAPVVFVDC